MKTNVRNCARCGQDHNDLEFVLLSNPTDEYGWWASCPFNGQPISLAVVADDAESGLVVAEEPRVRIDIELVRAANAVKQHVNSLRLEEIELCEKGKPVEIPQKVIDRWRFVGMTNWSFFADEFWRSPDFLKACDSWDERKIIEGNPEALKPQGVIEAWRK